MGNETSGILSKLIEHTVVKAHIDTNILTSLGHRGRIDYLIGAVEEAARLMPFDRRLQGDYALLRRDPEFRLYFSRGEAGYSAEKKNPAHKALNGF